MTTENRLYTCTNQAHPAFGKRFRVREIGREGMILCEWCTWANICTWVFVEDTSFAVSPQKNDRELA